MDRGWIIWRLRGSQLFEMVLVAVQCQWFFLGHGRRNCWRPGDALCDQMGNGIRIYYRVPAPVLVASFICFIVSWLLYRYLRCSTHRYGCIEIILQNRPALGLLETCT